MILFEKDWKDENGKPNAYVHSTTTNLSFIRMCVVLKKMGIKNHLFPLALTQPILANVDPRNVDSDELKFLIAHEAEVNGWYYLRELIRIDAPGSKEGIPYKLNRANLYLNWFIFLNLPVSLTIPRQTGKTIGVQSAVSWVHFIKGKNFTTSMVTKDDKLRSDNVSRLKQFGELLPPYLINKKPMKDIDNKQELKYAEKNNEYKSYVGSKDPKAADKVVRGSTTSLVHFDEGPFISNYEIVHGAAMPATLAGAKAAEEAGQPHGIIYTTTAAHLDTPEGKFAHRIVSEALPFSESLYDSENKNKLIDIIEKGSINGKVHGTFSYLQLGLGDEWLNNAIKVMGNPDQSLIDRELLNIWGSGQETSPISPEIIKKLKGQCKEDPEFSQIIKHGFVIRWYLSKSIIESNHFKNKSLIVSMDSSDQIGRDFTAIIILDPSTLEVIGTLRCNDSNVLNVAEIISDFLIEHKKAVWIPERKSSAISMIDYVTTRLLRNDYNPLRKIFNYFVHRKNDNSFKSKNLNSFTDDEILNSGIVRKQIGYMTTQATRNTLYKDILYRGIEVAGSRLNDPIIVEELAALKVKNGRIDHSSDSHDDMLIAWLLGIWFVLEGRNMIEYDLDGESILKNVVVESDKSRTLNADVKDKITDRLSVIEEKIKVIDDKLKDLTNPILRSKLNREKSSFLQLRNIIITRYGIKFDDHLTKYSVETNKNLR